MRNFVLLLLCLPIVVCAQHNNWQTPYEASGNITSATYKEAIDYYRLLAKKFASAELKTFGKTDIGLPLHLFMLSKSGAFDPAKIKAEGKSIILINNGIHPGESCGIDACMMLSRDLLTNKKLGKLLDSVVIAIIPVYNAGGSLNGSCCTRANQNGPTYKGFRGNARNLDLNRDFIKADSRNAFAFYEIFHFLDPEIFIDNHTTDGADYQHRMTLISTQPNKLGGALGDYLVNTYEPAIFKMMEGRDEGISPYVHTIERDPAEGIKAFLELPRYSTGYTALFQTLGFVPEAHMLKTYEERVMATYKLMLTFAKVTEQEGATIKKLRVGEREALQTKEWYPINWDMDKTFVDSFLFKGYKSHLVKSDISDAQVLKYHQTEPYTKQIKRFNTFKVTDSIRAPKAYVIPQSWSGVIERLKANGVEMKRVEAAESMGVQAYYLDKYETMTWPYEGHYLHYNTQVSKVPAEIMVYPGDYIVEVNQKANRYIVETLEPTAPDAFFNWNFFDEVLMQKEYFSGYVFDSTAARLLSEDPMLKADFDKAMASDSNMMENHRAQLDFIYKRSAYYEPTHKRYPVYRIE